MTTNSDGGDGQTSRLYRVWSLAYLGFVAAFSVWSCAAALRGQHVVAHADDWRILADFFSLPLSEFLFASQNGHRVPLTLLLFAADYRFFEGDQRLLVIASLATAAAAVAVLHQACRAANALDTAASRIAFGFAWFCTFWAGSSFYFLWGVCHGNLMALFWLFVCLLLLVRNETRRAPDRRHGSPRLLACAGLSAVMATYSFGSGFSVWIALLAVAVLARYPWKSIGGLAVAAALTLLAYTTGLSRGPAVEYVSVLSFLQRPLEAAEFVFTLIGAAPAWAVEGLRGRALARFHAPVDTWGGALAIAALAIHGVRIWRRPQPATRRDLLALGVMIGAVASAGLVAFGRSWLDQGAESHRRFLLWSVLFWAGAALALPSLRADGWRGAIVRTFAVAVPLVSLCMLPGMQQARLLEIARRDVTAERSLALLLDIHDPPLIASFWQNSSRDPGIVLRVAKRLRRDQRNLFAGPLAALPGERLLDHVTLAPAGSCAGVAVAPTRLSRYDIAARRIRGAAWSSGGATIVHVVVTDSGGVVRGLANLGRKREKRASITTSIPPSAYGYTGFLRDYDPGERYTTYGVSSDGRFACRLEPRAR